MMKAVWRICAGFWESTRHEFLPHYVTVNELLKKLETGELETLRRKMIKAILRRRTFEEARFLGKYWLVIFDATGLFHFHERHCPHCLKKTMNKGKQKTKRRSIIIVCWRQNWY